MGRPLALLVIAIAVVVFAIVGFALRPGVVIAAGLVAVGIVLVLVVVGLAGRADRSAPDLPSFARPEASAWVVDFVDRAFGTRGFDPTFIGLAWRHEPLTAQDRARLAETLSDAAMALLARDAIDEATFDEMVGPCGDLLGEAGDDH